MLPDMHQKNVRELARIAMLTNYHATGVAPEVPDVQHSIQIGNHDSSTQF